METSHLTAVGGTRYGYDDNGNLTSRGSDSFSWDAEDRLTSATVSSTTTTFAYNGEGLRSSRTVGGITTTFTWDVAMSIPQVLDDGTLRYVYGIGRIAQVASDDTTHYYLAAGLGSTMALVSSSGSVVNTYEYDVFGAVRSSSGSQANEFKFTGEQVDGSTGLQYLRARYYDASVGRFVTRDPLRGIDALPQSQDRYNYVLNNPANLLDPSGMCALGIPCPQPIKDAGTYVVRKAKEYLADPENQYSWIRTGAALLMGASCNPVSLATGIGATVCVGASGVYAASVAGTADAIRDKVCSGEYSADEGYARNIVGLLPIPFPVSSPIKAVLKEMIEGLGMGEGLYSCPVSEVLGVRHEAAKSLEQIGKE